MAYWPPKARREETISAFVEAFSLLGYSECEDPTHEPGMEKIALYAKGKTPTHAARQLRDGSWTSKCGRENDITHHINGLNGNSYGRPVKFMTRTIAIPRTTEASKKA